MPYADLPVTRVMQPLKLKEYLAPGDLGGGPIASRAALARVGRHCGNCRKIRASSHGATWLTNNSRLGAYGAAPRRVVE